jgi:hypothetical protein
LFDFASEHIEIQNTHGKRVEKLRVVRNHRASFVVIFKKLREMLDAGFVQIVGRLI